MPHAVIEAEPPSRTAPAFSITLPSGLRMSAVAGLPSIQ